jgi:hypothetical protein
MPFVKIQKKSSILGEPTVSEKQSFSYAPYPLPLFFWDYKGRQQVFFSMGLKGNDEFPLVWDLKGTTSSLCSLYMAIDALWISEETGLYSLIV